MTSVLWLGGVFNTSLFGIQLYIFGWVGLCVLAVLIHLIMYYGKWKPYGPMQGLYYSHKAGSNAAFIFDAPLHGEMVAEWEAKCIFDYSKWDYDLSDVPTISLPVIGKWLKSWLFYYPTAYLDNIDFLHAIIFKFGKVNKNVEIARHLQGGEWERSPSVNCGGVDVDIIIDTDNWTIRTSPQHRAIEAAVTLWNETNPTDQIHSYTKFQRLLLDKKILCPEVKKEVSIDWTRIDKGLTTNMEASEYIGKKIQMAEIEYNASQMMKNKMAVYVLLGGVGLAILMIVVRLITHYIH